MRVAVDKVEGWENLKPATKGDNAWLFVNEEVRAGPVGCCAVSLAQCGCLCVNEGVRPALGDMAVSGRQGLSLGGG